jgi:predicted nucleotidyltransferase component of viral defense system
MKTNQENFALLVNRAMTTDTVSHMRTVIEKELLHYDILFALEKGGLLDTLVFQGGTSLRLCHGANRFSEDLDFAGGKEFSSSTLEKMKNCIENYIGTRYGLEVTVKEPSKLRKDPKYAELKIDKWQISVVTSPDRKDVPKQKIKIEVANIPAYTKEPLPLRSNYDFLPDGYSDTLILTETLDEIMADKLVSLPATQKYIRNRDIWDLTWLKQQGTSVNAKLVQQKLEDYKIEQFSQLLDKRIKSIPSIIDGKDFNNEMKRFTPTDVFDRTLGQEKFKQYIKTTVVNLLQEVKTQLFNKNKTEAEIEFKM